MIDTHQGFKKLVDAGIPEGHAEATIGLLRDWVEERAVTREHLDSRLDELWVQIDGKIEGRFVAFCGEMDQRFAEVDQRFDGIDQRLDGIDQRLDGIDQRLDGLEGGFVGMQQELVALRLELDQRFIGARAENDLRLMELELRMTRRMIIAATAVTGFLSTLITVIAFLT